MRHPPARSCLPRLAAISIAVTAALTWQATALANAGVFFGNGHTVRLDSTDEIQLVREEVTIVPGRGRMLFTGGVPTDWVDYSCKFELRNLTDEQVEVQVGFPLSAQFHDYTPAEKYDEIELVQRHRFIARDEAETYHVRFVARDQEKRFRRLFLWKMTFAPNETRTLHVSYGMQMSIGAASTVSDWDDIPYGRKGTDSRWMRNMDTCLLQYFGYVTETGASWAGQIESARFRIATRYYEHYLVNRGWDEPIPGQPRDNDLLPAGPVLWHRSIQPSGGSPWVVRDGDPPVGTEWLFEPFDPGAPINVRYFHTIFPRDPDAMREFALRLAREEAADLSQLREIILAWHGVEPASEPVREFVGAQVWYDPSPNKTEEDLQPVEAALLAAIDDALEKS